MRTIYEYTNHDGNTLEVTLRDDRDAWPRLRIFQSDDRQGGETIYLEEKSFTPLIAALQSCLPESEDAGDTIELLADDWEAMKAGYARHDRQITALEQASQPGEGDPLEIGIFMIDDNGTRWDLAGLLTALEKEQAAHASTQRELDRIQASEAVEDGRDSPHVTYWKEKFEASETAHGITTGTWADEKTAHDTTREQLRFAELKLARVRRVAE